MLFVLSFEQQRTCDDEVQLNEKRWVAQEAMSVVVYLPICTTASGSLCYVLCPIQPVVSIHEEVWRGICEIVG